MVSPSITLATLSGEAFEWFARISEKMTDTKAINFL
jgi:hypothetical protein